MPKIKTHSGAKKRFSVTKNGKFKRHLRKEGFADATNVAQLKRLLPYK